MSTCPICYGSTPDVGRHTRWHRTMTNVPDPVGAVVDGLWLYADDGEQVTDVIEVGAATSGSYFWTATWDSQGVMTMHFGEPTPIHDALVEDLAAVRAFPSIRLGADTTAWLASMRAITERMIGREEG